MNSASATSVPLLPLRWWWYTRLFVCLCQPTAVMAMAVVIAMETTEATPKWMAAANDTLQLVNFFESTNTSYESNASASGGKK